MATASAAPIQKEPMYGQGEHPEHGNDRHECGDAASGW
jgi:hypothetical protein